jgi:hypothetical protein
MIFLFDDQWAHDRFILESRDVHLLTSRSLVSYVHRYDHVHASQCNPSLNGRSFCGPSKPSNTTQYKAVQSVQQPPYGIRIQH